MGCSIKAIADAEDRYEEQCRQLGVKPHLNSSGYLDCYGIHATLVRQKLNGKDVDISDLAVAVEKKKLKLDRIKQEIERKRQEIAELEKQLF